MKYLSRYKPKLKYNPLVVGAAIAGGASILNSLIGRSSQKSATKEQIKASKELMDYENEYNKPINVIERMKEAGLNPASVYGSQSPVTQAAASPVLPDTSSALGLGSGFVSSASQAGLVSAQIANLDSQSNLNNAQAGLTMIQQEIQRINRDYLPQVLASNLDNTQMDTLLKEATKNLNEEQQNQVKEQIVQIKNAQKLQKKELENWIEKIRQAKSEADMAELRAKATPEMIQKEFQKINSSIALNYRTCEQLSAVIQNVNADTDVKRVQNQIDQIALNYADEQQRETTRRMKDEAQTAAANRSMSLKQDERMAAGQDAALYLAPVRETFSSIGSALGSILGK